MNEPVAIETDLLASKRKRQREAAAKARAKQTPEQREARLAYNRAYSANWRRTHPEARLAYENANRDAIATKRAAWRAANRDKRAAAHRRYYEARGDEIRANHRARYAADPARFKEYSKAYREKQGDAYRQRARANGLGLNYGITLAIYDALLEAQRGLCAICGRPPTSARSRFLHVDHDHRTGRVRGLLCPACNRALGAFQDDPAILTAAIAYLAMKLPVAIYAPPRLNAAEPRRA